MKNYLLVTLIVVLLIIFVLIIAVGIYIEKHPSKTTPPNPPTPPVPPTGCPAYSMGKSKYIPNPLYRSISNVSSESDCQNQCTANLATYNSSGNINNGGCVWYNYDTNTRTCDLGHGESNPNVSTGFRITDTDRSCPKWYTIKGMDVTGYDNTNLPSYPYQVTGESGCKALCDQYKCDWYNYVNNTSPNCYLKSAVTATNKNLGLPITSPLNNTGGLTN